ncbi:hypothetical protein IMSAGC014_01078 [Bacteroidaceae bacterium]|nr:hypothetical protein IMSAGC014_01078 [Bacteroidaceae bacterium]
MLISGKSQQVSVPIYNDKKQAVTLSTNKKMEEIAHKLQKLRLNKGKVLFFA